MISDWDCDGVSRQCRRMMLVVAAEMAEVEVDAAMMIQEGSTEGLEMPF